jgi:small subunit ribosomal protein S19
MCRSKWKIPFVDLSLIKKISNSTNTNTKVKVWARNSVIPSLLLKKIVLVHDGKDFKKIFITRDKIGFKFGYFVSTRRKVIKIKKNKLNKK